MFSQEKPHHPAWLVYMYYIHLGVDIHIIISICTRTACQTTLYVGMARGNVVSITLYIHWYSILRSKIQKWQKSEEFVKENIEHSYYKLAWKVSRHAVLANK